MSKENQLSEQQISWAYGVLEGFIEAFNRVAGTTEQNKKVELSNQLNQEYVANLAKLDEAFIILAQPVHRQMIQKYFKAYAEVFESWRPIKKT